MMVFDHLDALTRAVSRESRALPVAIVWNENDFAIEQTISHLRAAGFGSIILCGSPILSPAESILDLPGLCILRAQIPETFASLLNHLMPHLSGRWVHPCYNGEFLFYPFGASRTITDALAFASDERRNSVFGLTLDLYCDSLDPASSTAPKGDAMFDAAGYFPASSLPAADTEDPVVDVAGGLRWRFSEFVPQDRLSLSRVCAFRAGPGVRVSGDLCYSPPSLHAVSSRWHHSVTMVVASFRAARALRTNPDSCRASSSFEWALSQRFDWTPDQLLKLGFMEPGQWF